MEIVGGNQAPFTKKIYRILNTLEIDFKINNGENRLKKKQRNFISIIRRNIKNYLNIFSKKVLETNKSFWRLIKSFELIKAF